jgi:hypothetical protein
MNMKEDILPVMAGNRGSTVRGQVNDVWVGGVKGM